MSLNLEKKIVYFIREKIDSFMLFQLTHPSPTFALYPHPVPTP